MINDQCTYQIILHGRVEAADLLPYAPPGLTVHRDETGRAILTVRTDQSGLVGLIRLLHGLGLAIHSIISR